MNTTTRYSVPNIEFMYLASGFRTSDLQLHVTQFFRSFSRRKMVGAVEPNPKLHQAIN